MRLSTVFLTIPMAAGFVLPAAAQQNPIQGARDAYNKVRPEQLQNQQQRRAPQTPAGRAAAAAPAPPQTAAPGDLGTPEGTAKLAASLRFLDVAGVKLGMESKDVPAAMKAVNPSFRYGTQHVCPDTMHCDKKTAPVFAVAAMDDKTQERFEIAMTTSPPGPAFVHHISRSVRMPEGARPTVNTVVDSLRTKYGPETANPDLVAWETRPFLGPDGTRVYRWNFDAQGQLIRWTKDKEMVLRDCGFGEAVGSGASGPVILDSFYGGGRPRIDTTFCAGTMVTAMLSVTPSGLVQVVDVIMNNRRLDSSGRAATWDVLDRMVKDKLEQDRKKGQTVAPPKL